MALYESSSETRTGHVEGKNVHGCLWPANLVQPCWLDDLNVQGDKVQVFLALFRGAELPVTAAGRVAQKLIHSLYKTCDVDDRMAGKDLGQTLGQVAGQAAAGSFVQAEFKPDPTVGVTTITQADIVGAVVGVAEQGLEKIIGALLGKELLKGCCGKKGIDC